jgi:hypothetical protein
MAKRSHARSHALARYSAPRAPKPIVIRTTTIQKAKKHHRRGRSGGLGEKHRVGAIVGGGVLGLIQKSGVSLPSLPFLGQAGTLGVAAWAVGKYMHSPWAEDLATGFLAIAAYELASTGTIAGETSGYVAGGF